MNLNLCEDCKKEGKLRDVRCRAVACLIGNGQLQSCPTLLPDLGLLSQDAKSAVSYAQASKARLSLEAT